MLFLRGDIAGMEQSDRSLKMCRPLRGSLTSPGVVQHSFFIRKLYSYPPCDRSLPTSQFSSNDIQPIWQGTGKNRILSSLHSYITIDISLHLVSGGGVTSFSPVIRAYSSQRLPHPLQWRLYAPLHIFQGPLRCKPLDRRTATLEKVFDTRGMGEEWLVSEIWLLARNWL